MVSITFLLVLSMLWGTDWSWELRTWSHKMNFLDILSTSHHYFSWKWIRTTNGIQGLSINYLLSFSSSSSSFSLLSFQIFSTLLSLNIAKTDLLISLLKGFKAWVKGVFWEYKWFAISLARKPRTPWIFPQK